MCVCVLEILRKAFINYSSARIHVVASRHQSVEAERQAKASFQRLTTGTFCQAWNLWQKKRLYEALESYKTTRVRNGDLWRLVIEVVRWAGGLPVWKYIAHKPDGSWEGLGRSGKTVAGRGLKAYALKLLLLMMMMAKQYSATASIYHFIRY